MYWKAVPIDRLVREVAPKQTGVPSTVSELRQQLGLREVRKCRCYMDVDMSVASSPRSHIRLMSGGFTCFKLSAFPPLDCLCQSPPCRFVRLPPRSRSRRTEVTASTALASIAVSWWGKVEGRHAAVNHTPSRPAESGRARTAWLGTSVLLTSGTCIRTESSRGTQVEWPARAPHTTQIRHITTRLGSSWSSSTGKAPLRWSTTQPCAARPVLPSSIANSTWYLHPCPTPPGVRSMASCT